MGQLFTLALVPASFRCGRSDYGAVKTSFRCYPASTPSFFELSRSLRSFPATLSLSVSNPHKEEGKGGLCNVQ